MTTKTALGALGGLDGLGALGDPGCLSGLGGLSAAKLRNDEVTFLLKYASLIDLTLISFSCHTKLQNRQCIWLLMVVKHWNRALSRWLLLHR